MTSLRRALAAASAALLAAACGGGSSGDTSPPAAPVLAATVPASPSAQAVPHLTGTAEAGSTLRAFAGADCTGAPVATATVPASGAFDVAVSATPNDITTFRATATDEAGNTSTCSAGLDYVHDDVPPAAPALVTTVPASPSFDPAPRLAGTAEPLATVRAYATADCSGAPLATANVPAGGTFDLAAAAAPNATREFRATATDAAGNVSACSAPLAYAHDDVPPAAPVVARAASDDPGNTSTRPGGPANDLTPLVTGTAPPGAFVRVYEVADCIGPVAAQTVAAPDGSFTAVPTVAANVSTTFGATAVDEAGNASSCAAGPAYVHDSIDPAAPVFSDPTPPSGSNYNFPEVEGTGEPGALVALFTNATCSGAAVSSGTVPPGGRFFVPVEVLDNTVTRYWARQVDEAQNPSPCTATSIEYVEESRTLTVSPSTVTLDLAPGASLSQAFTYAVNGGPDPGVDWSVEEGVGDITPAGVFTAPPQAGTYHVVARARVPSPAVVVARAAVTVRLPVVTISPAAYELITTQQLGLEANVAGCADQTVTWSVVEAGGGSVEPAGPSISAVYTAPATPGTWHVEARAACEPAAAATATVTVRAPLVSGTVSYDGAAAGPVFVALLTSWGEVVGGTRLEAPGPFTIRGVQQAGSYVLRAWIDALGVERPVPHFDPSADVPVNLLPGADATGLVASLADPAPLGAPPAPTGLMAFPGDGFAVLSWERVKDASRLDLADAYHVSCDTVPPTGVPVTRDLHLDDATIFILPAANGETWSCSVWASAGGLPGAVASTGDFPVGPATGVAVSGTVLADQPFPGGVPPGGLLYAVLLSNAAGVAARIVHSPSFDQAFSIAGVIPGAWGLGAILDLAGDGVIARTDPNGMQDGGTPVDVPAGGLTGLQTSLSFADARAAVLTIRNQGAGGASWNLRFRVTSGLKVPVAAALRPGPNVPTTVDLGILVDEGGDALHLGTGWSLGATAPQVGDAYTIDVVYDDLTAGVLQASVTAVLDPPRPLAPVDPVVPPLVEPATPVFSWDPPSTPPAGAYGYTLSVGGPGATWWYSGLPSTTHTATWNENGRATPSTLAAGTYGWSVIVRDAQGNEASSGLQFTVSGP